MEKVVRVEKSQGLALVGKTKHKEHYTTKCMLIRQSSNVNSFFIYPNKREKTAQVHKIIK
jgi:hypothetical protein